VNLPPNRYAASVGDSPTVQKLSEYALLYGERGYLPCRDSVGDFVVEVRTLNFSSMDYRDAGPGEHRKQCSAIPENVRDDYRSLLYTLPVIEWVCRGADYNVPVTGEKIYNNRVSA